MPPTSKRLAVFALFLLASCSRSLEDVVAKARADGFEGVIQVERAGEVLMYDAWGVAIDASEEQPAIDNTTDTVFTVGSLTKQFTGAAMVEAEARGLLSLDDRLSDHFPDVPADRADVTLHDLLTHAGGFAGGLGPDPERITREAYLALAWETDHRVPVGRFRYSNTGYSLLAAALEQAAGQPYETLLRQWFFLPLGMEHTGYESPDWSDSVVAHGYSGSEIFGPPVTVTYDTEGPFWHLTGNGGVLSTATDMHRWTMALMDGEVLTPAGREALFDRHIVAEVPGFWYGYGWGIEEWSLMGQNINHDGGNGFFHAFVVWWPEDELYVGVYSNRDGDRFGTLAWPISQAVLR